MQISRNHPKDPCPIKWPILLRGGRKQSKMKSKDRKRKVTQEERKECERSRATGGGIEEVRKMQAVGGRAGEVIKSGRDT